MPRQCSSNRRRTSATSRWVSTLAPGRSTSSLNIRAYGPPIHSPIGAVKPRLGNSHNLPGSRRRASARNSVLPCLACCLRRAGIRNASSTSRLIEQRATDLETVRHAHSVDFHEWIVGHVHLEIRVLGSLHGIGRRTAAIGFGHRLVHRTLRHVVIRCAPHQATGCSGLQEREVRVVGTGDGSRPRFSSSVPALRNFGRSRRRGQCDPSHAAAALRPREGSAAPTLRSRAERNGSRNRQSFRPRRHHSTPQSRADARYARRTTSGWPTNRPVVHRGPAITGSMTSSSLGSITSA